MSARVGVFKKNAPTKGDMGCFARKRRSPRVTTKSYVNAGKKGFLQLNE
jgi:hypothetical protein